MDTLQYGLNIIYKLRQEIRPLAQYGILLLPSFLLGIISVIYTQRVYPLSDMLRSFTIDLAVIAVLIVFRVRIRSFTGIIICVLYFSIFFINLFHIHLYNAPLSLYAIGAFFETNTSELSEFVLDYASLSTALLFLIPCTIAVFYAKLSKENRICTNKYIIAFCVVYAIIIISVAITKKQRYIKSHFGAYFVYNTYKYFTERESAIAEHEKVYFSGARSIGGQSPETYIIILGESASRFHMSCYGYTRKTTPHLDMLVDGVSNQPYTTFAFDNVISSETHTIPSLRNMLLIQELVDGKEVVRGSILDVLRSAGFKTWWISNQIPAPARTTTSMIAAGADVVHYLNRSIDEGRTSQYDEVVLPDLKKALCDSAERKVIFIHLLGSHLSYALRYPATFGVFTDSKGLVNRAWHTATHKKYINAYDNSILYTDSVIDDILTYATGQTCPVGVLYVSDHGQEVYYNLPIRGQAAHNPTRNMFAVPLFAFVSDGYVTNHVSLVQQMKLRRQTPYMTKGFAHTIASFTGVTFDAFDEKASFFSEAYTPSQRIVVGQYDYDALPTKEATS